MKRRFLLVLLLTIHVCGALNPIDWFHDWLHQLFSSEQVAEKQYTILVYFAADNDLHPFVQGDIDELTKIGSTDRVNVLAYLSTSEPDVGKISRKLVIKQGETEQWGVDKSRDSGDWNTLYSAIKWGHKHFPAKHFVLVLWDHGSGSLNRYSKIGMPWWHHSLKQRAICYDDTTGNYLKDYALRNALQKAVSELRDGKKIDLLAFDACLMADIEVAYTIKDYVDWSVGSQETIPGTGYGYDKILRAITSEIDTPEELAHVMVEAYHDEYINDEDAFTFSAFDLKQVDPLVVAINNIAMQLQILLSSFDAKKQNAVLKAIKRASSPRYCMHFDSQYYLDLAHVLTNLLTQVPVMRLESEEEADLRAALRKALVCLDACVVYKMNGPAYRDASGLSIYFDQKMVDPDYRSLYWAKNTQWLSFLETYVDLRTGL